MLRTNGYSITFSLNLYSKDQELEKQCEEIDAIYQKVVFQKTSYIKFGSVRHSLSLAVRQIFIFHQGLP